MTPRLPRPGATALAVLGAALALPATAAARHHPGGGSAELRFAVAPPSSWVEPVPVPLDHPPPGDAPASYTLLSDSQTRYDGAATERYYHFAELVVSPAGIDGAATVRAYFEPSYERLTLHWVRVHRGGAVREALDRAQVRLAHVEDDLRARIYHGIASAIFFVPDVRVGDVVEVAFTTRGDNPVFGGHVLGDTDLAQTYPIAHLRERLLVRGDRQLDVHSEAGAAEPARRQRAGWQELLWDASDVAAVETESDAPAWQAQLPRARWSDFASWAEVQRWARDLYQAPAGTAAELAPLAGRLRAAAATPADRLLAATRFVQDEVRYLGIEAGASSHRPHAPADVLAQRFGDCKDKALLLAALLDELGIEATPALVDSDGDPGLGYGPPSPLAFDHVIVRARLPDGERWIDATVTMARGRGLPPPPFRWALLVAGGAAPLVPIPEPALDRPELEVAEEYQVPERDGDSARLRATTWFRGSQADALRRRLTASTPADIGRGYLDFYARDFPGISAEGEPTFDDDQDDNVIVVHERYTIPRFWKDGARELAASEVAVYLDEPDGDRHGHALAVDHPVWVRQEMLLHLPDGFDVTAEHKAVHSRYFDATYASSVDGNDVNVVFEYRTSGGVVPAGEVAGYAQEVSDARDLLGFGLGPGEPARAGSAGLGTIAVGLGIGVVLVGFIFVIVWITGRPLPRPPADPRPHG